MHTLNGSIDAVCSNSPSAIAAIEHVFSQFGIPETIVSDNAACFTGKEFKAFTISNGIMHITSAPHHPSSNRLAECVVQIVKNGLKKLTKGTLNSRLAKILFCLSYHTTVYNRDITFRIDVKQKTTM